MLKNTFIGLVSNFSTNENLILNLWKEIENNYTNINRYYHSLVHIENLYSELLLVKDEIIEWDTLLFSVYYHDIIYKAHKSNNEFKSAVFAEKCMQLLCVEEEKIESCKKQIISTKFHSKSKDSDTNYLLDADLSILGTEWNTYLIYSKNVRKEYKIYPTFLYNKGRVKALKNFLLMKRIYKTDIFYEKYNQQAHINILNEIKLLENK